MAKAVALLAFSLCALVVAVYADFTGVPQKLFPEAALEVIADGEVLCDICRQKNLKTTTFAHNAKVELRCISRKTRKLTLVAPETADDGGFYRIYVKDNYADDICRVRVVSNPDPMCNEIVPGISSARVRLFENDGNITIGPQRFVKPIGFMRKEALHNCTELLAQA